MTNAASTPTPTPTPTPAPVKRYTCRSCCASTEGDVHNRECKTPEAREQWAPAGRTEHRSSRVKIDKRIPDLMSMAEVAEMYDVSKQAVHLMIQSGKLPAAQVGRQWVIRRSVAEGLTVDGGQLVEGAPRNAPACSICGWGDRSTTGPALSIHQRTHHP